jgi:hypothetical protein
MADPPQRQGSFWTSVTGVITAVAAFIAAVGTLAGVLAAVGAWPLVPKTASRPSSRSRLRNAPSEMSKSDMPARRA